MGFSGGVETKQKLSKKVKSLVSLTGSAPVHRVLWKLQDSVQVNSLCKYFFTLSLTNIAILDGARMSRFQFERIVGMKLCST